ncbi:hypothetical protein GW17_00045302, partial [Ensete ventricosum]
VEATTNSSTKPLLPSRASYARSLSHVDDKLKSFRSCLKWMCVNESEAMHVMIFRSLFVPTTSHFVLSCAPTNRAYDVVV